MQRRVLRHARSGAGGVRFVSQCAQGIHAGGPGSGCQGPNCGRPPNPDAAVKVKWQKSTDSKGVQNGFKAKVNGKEYELKRIDSQSRVGRFRWIVLVDGNPVMRGRLARAFPNAQEAKNAAVREEGHKTVERPRKEKESEKKDSPGSPKDYKPRAGDLPIGDTPLASMKVIAAKSVRSGGANGMMEGKEILTFEDGSKGLFKPRNGEVGNPAWAGGGDLRQGIKAGTYYKREALAYDFARNLGMTDLVPETTVREYKGQIGSVMKWVAGDIPHGMIDWHDHVSKLDMERSAAFDYLIGNTDRHNGNFLIQRKTAGNANGKIQLIDHGLSFPPRFSINTGNAKILKGRNPNSEFPEHIKTAYRDKLPDLERAMRSKEMPQDSIDAMKDRYNRIMGARSWIDIQQSQRRTW